MIKLGMSLLAHLGGLMTGFSTGGGGNNLLQEDGASYFLQEDGTSKFILE